MAVSQVTAYSCNTARHSDFYYHCIVTDSCTCMVLFFHPSSTVYTEYSACGWKSRD